MSASTVPDLSIDDLKTMIRTVMPYAERINQTYALVRADMYMDYDYHAECKSRGQWYVLGIRMRNGNPGVFLIHKGTTEDLI